MAQQLARASGGRAVSPARLHLTLRFIGVVDPRRVGALLRAAGRVRAAPFALCLDTLGAFGRARVAWAGCLASPPPLLDLQEGLASALAVEGFPRDSQRFAPHVTLVRDLGAGAAPAPAPGVEPLCWDVRRYSLLAAETGQARYAWLGSWPLKDETR